MSGTKLSIEEQGRRLTIAREVADKGGNLTMFAGRLGMSIKSARQFLLAYDESLHVRLAYAPRGPRTEPHQALVRLLLLKSVEGIKGAEARLAKALGVTPTALWNFRQKWASDGIDAAIADLMPEDVAHG